MKRTCLLQAFLLLAFALGAVSCDLLVLTPQMKIDIQPELEVGVEGGKFSARIETNCPWRAQVYAPTGVKFISMVTSQGEAGTSTLEFEVKPNLIATLRGNTIQVIAENAKGQRTFDIAVRQLAAEPFAQILDWEDPLVPAEGGTVTIKVVYNTTTGLVCLNRDIRIVWADNDPGFSGGQPVTSRVTITVPANPSTEARSFNLELVCVTHAGKISMGTLVLRQAAGA